MLSQQIADKICAKVSTLVSQDLRLTDAEGNALSQTSALKPESIDISSHPWAIPFSYSGNVVGYIVLAAEMPNHEEIAPLIRSIAELVMHQSLVLEQIPRQDERLDKFIYDLLNQPQPDWTLLAAEALPATKTRPATAKSASPATNSASPGLSTRSTPPAAKTS